MTDPTIKAQASALATYNPDGAKKLLTDNGFTYNGSQLLDPKGNPVSFQIHVISGWSDWVASLQIITKNLQAIGIDATTQARARLQHVVPGRLQHEGADAALAERLAGLAVRVLLREPAPERDDPLRARTQRRPATGSTSRMPARPAS